MATEALNPVRVVIADDQTLVRAGFSSILEDEDDIEIVGQADTGQSALNAARRWMPDVILMDIRMPGTDGLTATEIISADRELDEVKVVILTTFSEDDYVYRALRAGASGFLLKDIDPDDLAGAVRVVAAGDALISPAITRKVISEFAQQVRRPEPAENLNVLTGREREVLRLVAAGLSNRELAEHLYISPATAKTHVSRVMQKLGARDRAQLVVMGYESGLVTPGWARGEDRDR
ncbi:response regulator [Haloglycomyces albus]|uniref:response regulator n=1 Tax=Haloglycomyces albus TaxID=526067 RepID=UPI00046CB6CB|nr:response regulator transcription factor [Haloglycomyces albus]